MHLLLPKLAKNSRRNVVRHRQPWAPVGHLGYSELARESHETGNPPKILLSPHELRGQLASWQARRAVGAPLQLQLMVTLWALAPLRTIR